YNDQGDYEHALYYFNKSKPITNKDAADQMESFLHLSMIYEKANYLDAALLYGKKAYDLDIKINGRSEREYIPIILGNVYYKKEKYSIALDYYRIAELNPKFNYTNKDGIEVYNGMANSFGQIGKLASASYYAQKALSLRKLISYPLGTLNTYKILASIYKKQGKLDSAVTYLEQTSLLRDT